MERRMAGNGSPFKNHKDEPFADFYDYFAYHILQREWLHSRIEAVSHPKMTTPLPWDEIKMLGSKNLE